MKFLLSISFLLSFVTFSQSDSVSIYPLSIPIQYGSNHFDIKKFVDSSFVYPPYNGSDFIYHVGTVYVQFRVDTVGVVDCVKVVKGLSVLIDAEAKRVVEALPNLPSKTYYGKKVNSFYILPIEIKSEMDPRFISYVPPNYPGGLDAMIQFISENYQFPEVESEEKIIGTIYVQGLINEDGSISNVEIRKGMHELYDKEAIRIVKKMPNWIPAENEDGTKTEVYHIIQVRIL